MRAFLDDVRAARRRLQAQPAVTIVAGVTIALGLGANLAIFTLVYSLLLRPLPVDRPGELYRLGDNNNCCVNSGLQNEGFSLFSFRLFEHLRANTDGFRSLAGVQAATGAFGVRRAGSAVAESFPGQFVTGNYFTTFGVRPAAGRLLTDADDRPGAPPVVVISHRAWAHFGLDSAIVGETLAINGQPMTVVGVAEPQFFGEAVRVNPAAFWLPFAQEPRLRGEASLIDRPEQHWLYAVGRAVPGADPARMAATATAALRGWLTQQTWLSDDERETLPRQQITVASAAGGVELLRYGFGAPLRVLIITSGLVLLIACANLANLLLAKADRAQAAIRGALGATRARLVRQAVIEGVMLSLAGAAAALILGTAAARALVTLTFPAGSFVPADLSPSLTTLLFAASLALVTGVLFSAAPAFAMSTTQPIDALHGVGRGGHDRAFVPRGSLVILQVALSVVLLTGAGLLTRSLGNLEGQPLGFEINDRVVARIDPPPYAGDTVRLASLYERLHTRLRQIPGVTASTHALYSPMESNNWSTTFHLAPHGGLSAVAETISWNRVGPGYFAITGTRVLRGRDFSAPDHAGSAAVAIVNEAFVRRFQNAESPLGRRLGRGGPAHANDLEIVGVVEDVKYSGPQLPTRPMIFMPTLQTVAYSNADDATTDARSMLARSLVLQTGLGTGALEPQLKRALADVDSALTVVQVRTLADQVSGNFRLTRVMSRLFSVYAGLALVIAAVGLYGVTAFAASRRTREIGIRMALGADRGDVLRAMLRGPMTQTLIGLGIGAPLALAASGVLQAQLYDVEPRNVWMVAIAALTLLATAFVAAVAPAFRAASVNPTQALR